MSPPYSKHPSLRLKCRIGRALLVLGVPALVPGMSLPAPETSASYSLYVSITYSCVRSASASIWSKCCSSWTPGGVRSAGAQRRGQGDGDRDLGFHSLLRGWWCSALQGSFRIAPGQVFGASVFWAWQGLAPAFVARTDVCRFRSCRCSCAVPWAFTRTEGRRRWFSGRAGQFQFLTSAFASGARPSRMFSTRSSRSSIRLCAALAAASRRSRS